jgi:uncharacterized protein YfiM (DUF2279 family)
MVLETTVSEEADSEAYDPNRMLNALKERIGVADDSALARKLKVAPSVIRMLREGQLKVSASMLMWMHDASGIGVPELRELLRDRRARFRMKSR